MMPRLPARIASTVFLFTLVGGCAIQTASGPSAETDPDSEKQAILAVIQRMETAWNDGDFAGYMKGFANPDVVFVSRGEFQKDWQATLDHYIRDYGGSEDMRARIRSRRPIDSRYP